MTDRLDEIRARAEAVTPRMSDAFKIADLIAVAREDIPYLLAEVERLRAALLDENEQLTADLAAANEECDRLMDLYLAQRREHNKAAVEVERLRAALNDLIEDLAGGRAVYQITDTLETESMPDESWADTLLRIRDEQHAVIAEGGES